MVDQPTVHNKYKRITPQGSVYIGRGSPSGNPFIMGVHGTREEVCDKFKDTQRKITSLDEVVRHARGKFKPGSIVPGFYLRAELDIIVRSAKELVAYVDEKGYKKVLIPRPGAGAGELDWNETKKALEPILDDRFTIVSFLNEE